MAFPERMKFGLFMGPHHRLGENPTLALERNLELIQWLDYLGFDEVWIGEHHSAGWETVASPEIFLAVAAERTKHIKLGTGVVSLPYHHPFMVAERMVLLDHLTRGRAMFGVGPGALVSDADTLGIPPNELRPRMDEALGIIMRLFTETEPITYKSHWFEVHEAQLQLRPYTKPHMPIAVAAVQSPAGMVAAAKHGAAVLSFSVPRGGGDTKEFWRIAEDTAAEHGRTMDRSEWRITLPVFLAESRKEALKQARLAAGLQQREYTEGTLGYPAAVEGPADRIVDEMVDRGLWCVGTPDDLIGCLERFDDLTGGYGGLLVFMGEWGTREQVLHSYELIARYVMPRFQGSLVGLEKSQAKVAAKSKDLHKLRTEAIQQAKDSYVEHRAAVRG